jgi:hypothetical protein
LQLRIPELMLWSSEGSERPLPVSAEIFRAQAPDLSRLFALEITADRAAVLTGLNHKTAAAIFKLLRHEVVELARSARSRTHELQRRLKIADPLLATRR